MPLNDWLSKNVSSWGKIILIIAHLWVVVELFLKSYLTLCFYGGLNQIQSDICSYNLPKNGPHDLLFATIHSDIKPSVPLRTVGATQALLRVDRFLFSPSLIYRPLLPHFCVSSLSAPASFFLTLRVAWRSHSWAHWPGGAVLLFQNWTIDPLDQSQLPLLFSGCGLWLRAIRLFWLWSCWRSCWWVKVRGSAGSRSSAQNWFILVLPGKSKTRSFNRWHLLLYSLSVNVQEKSSLSHRWTFPEHCWFQLISLDLRSQKSVGFFDADALFLNNRQVNYSEMLLCSSDNKTKPQ